MEQKPLFVTKDNQGKPQIGFIDSEGDLWYVNPLNLYKSLFNDITKENHVDQVVMLDNEGHLYSDMDVTLSNDGSATYWLYLDGKSTVWSNEDEFDDKWKMLDNYQTNVLEVLNEYYLAAREYGIDKLCFSKGALEIISDQFKLAKLKGSDPWRLGYEDSSMQHEYYRDCLFQVERFDMSIENDAITWSFKKKGEIERRITTTHIPLASLDLTLIKRALEDFCLYGDTTFKIQSKGTRDIQATTVYLHNIKDKHLSRFGAITEVVVVPEDYDYEFPVLYGYGFTCQVVKKLYDSFLSSLIWKEKGTNLLDGYNLFKSPIIEFFLTGKDVLTARTTNRVKYLCCIAPDIYEHWRDEYGISCIADNGVFEIADDPGGYNVIYKAIAPTFCDWHQEYEDATDFAETTTDAKFNYEEWHRRGLALARTVRNQLPDDVDIWYMYAFEDRSHHSEKNQILRSSKEHLLYEGIRVIIEEDLVDKDKWIEILEAFIAQSPCDCIFDE